MVKSGKVPRCQHTFSSPSREPWLVALQAGSKTLQDETEERFGTYWNDRSDTPAATDADSPAVMLAALQALEINEPWLAPICRRLRELAAVDRGHSRAARQAMQYIAASLPPSEAAYWRALLEAQDSAHDSRADWSRGSSSRDQGG
jgi:hypothetical protein